MTRATTTDEKKGNGKGRGKQPIEQPKAEVTKVYESGQTAFMRIAAKRVNRILEKLGTLAKLASGKSKYGYSDGDVEYIRKTLIDGVNSACDRLRRKPVKGDFSFRRDSDSASS